MTIQRFVKKLLLRRGWVRIEWVRDGTVRTWRKRSHRETTRARQGEALLREIAALVRNDGNYQRWRHRAIRHLQSTGRYDRSKAKPSDLFCERCESTMEGMHWSGAYTYDGDRLYTGGSCPFADEVAS